MVTMFATNIPGNPLAGLRVLLVEDDFMIAVRLQRMLAELGCIVVGPTSSVDEGVRLASNNEVDAAVLDINIRGGNSGPIAERLSELGRPFFFVTGYTSPHLLSDRLAGVRRLMKPVEGTALRDALLEQIGRA